MSILKEPVTKNITEVKKVKNVSNNTPFIFNGKYVILPGQVDLIEDKDWIGKEIWKNYLYCNEGGSQVRLLECHHRSETVTEDKTKIITYAVKDYLAKKDQAAYAPTQVVVEGVTYNGVVVSKGSNSIIFIKEGVITPVEPDGITLKIGDTTVTTATVAATETITVTPVITPNTATDKTVYWLSEDTSKATVDAATGVITGVATGTVDVHCISMMKPEINTFLTVTVTAAPVQDNTEGEG